MKHKLLKTLLVLSLVFVAACEENGADPAEPSRDVQEEPAPPDPAPDVAAPDTVAPADVPGPTPDAAPPTPEIIGEIVDQPTPDVDQPTPDVDQPAPDVIPDVGEEPDIQVPGPDVEPSAGACDNAADLHILETQGDTAVQDAMGTCAMRCLMGGTPTCHTDCVRDETGLSQQCSECFGAMLECTMDHCALPCATNASGPNCISCMEDNCYDGFEACAGMRPL